VIYFIRCPKTSQIKIGTTLGLARRLGQLARDRKTTLEVLAVMPGDQSREADLHHQFGHLRMEGEWFDPGMDLLDFIRDHGRPWDGTTDESVAKARPMAPACDLTEEEFRRKADAVMLAIRFQYVQRMLELLSNIPEDRWDSVMRSELRDASKELAFLLTFLPEEPRKLARLCEKKAEEDHAKQLRLYNAG
jgi:hypothetical protein